MPFDFPFHHSGAAPRRICRALLVGAALSVASAAAAAEKGPGGAVGVQPASPRVSVPALDIRANIMRQLREGRKGRPNEPVAPGRSGQGPATSEPRPPATPTAPAPDAPAVAEPEQDPEPAEPKTPTRADPAQRTQGQSGRTAAPETGGGRGSNHVPVPKKTLTIRQLQDVDRLADELDRARRTKENGGG